MTDNPSYFTDKIDDLIGRYENKINNMRLSDSKKHKIFKHWKAIARGILPTDKHDIFINTDSDVIDSYVVDRYDTESHQILYYIVTEFRKLLSYNKSTFLKSSIASFIVEFIDRIFFEFNIEHLMSNPNIRRFEYIAKSPKIKEIMEEAESDIEKEGIYGEVVNPDDEITDEIIESQIDDREEEDAIDIDTDFTDLEEGIGFDYDNSTDMAYEQLGSLMF